MDKRGEQRTSYQTGQQGHSHRHQHEITGSQIGPLFDVWRTCPMSQRYGKEKEYCSSYCDPPETRVEKERNCQNLQGTNPFVTQLRNSSLGTKLRHFTLEVTGIQTERRYTNSHRCPKMTNTGHLRQECRWLPIEVNCKMTAAQFSAAALKSTHPCHPALHKTQKQRQVRNTLLS